MGVVGYTIHELNAALAKADAGNTDNDSGAPHNWDEGWASSTDLTSTGRRSPAHHEEARC